MILADSSDTCVMEYVIGLSGWTVGTAFESTLTAAVAALHAYIRIIVAMHSFCHASNDSNSDSNR